MTSWLRSQYHAYFIKVSFNCCEYYQTKIPMYDLTKKIWLHASKSLSLQHEKGTSLYYILFVRFNDGYWFHLDYLRRSSLYIIPTRASPNKIHNLYHRRNIRSNSHKRTLYSSQIRRLVFSFIELLHNFHKIIRRFNLHIFKPIR